MNGTCAVKQYDPLIFQSELQRFANTSPQTVRGRILAVPWCPMRKPLAGKTCSASHVWTSTLPRSILNPVFPAGRTPCKKSRFRVASRNVTDEVLHFV